MCPPDRRPTGFGLGKPFPARDAVLGDRADTSVRPYEHCGPSNDEYINSASQTPYSTDDFTYFRLMIVPIRMTTKRTAPMAEANPKLLKRTAW